MRMLLLLALVSTCAACSAVPPHARGRLMERSMQAASPLDAAFDVHVEEVRESAVGASSGEGASCGCR